MENGDEWLAPDKLQHVVACLLITACVSGVLSRSRYRFLRRWSTPLGCGTALVAGIAKEAGDELGFWESAGASLKDGVADVFGVFIAAVFLSLSRKFSPSSPEKVDRDRELSMV
ncbi:unnamed protein product [Spirodela intermedia]|uniref:Uncharacterized protein n=1 Tax=Spirodela intermedia TaxID=51605 RepID=A0A7I8LDL4_SPIIN|nr:unnamed protein product [Spirodela intermedia]